MVDVESVQRGGEQGEVWVGGDLQLVDGNQEPTAGVVLGDLGGQAGEGPGQRSGVRACWCSGGVAQAHASTDAREADVEAGEPLEGGTCPTPRPGLLSGQTPCVLHEGLDESGLPPDRLEVDHHRSLGLGDPGVGGQQCGLTHPSGADQDGVPGGDPPPGCCVVQHQAPVPKLVVAASQDWGLVSCARGVDPWLHTTPDLSLFFSITRLSYRAR